MKMAVLTFTLAVAALACAEGSNGGSADGIGSAGTDAAGIAAGIGAAGTATAAGTDAAGFGGVGTGAAGTGSTGTSVAGTSAAGTAGTGAAAGTGAGFGGADSGAAGIGSAGTGDEQACIDLAPTGVGVDTACQTCMCKCDAPSASGCDENCWKLANCTYYQCQQMNNQGETSEDACIGRACSAYLVGDAGAAADVVSLAGTPPNCFQNCSTDTLGPGGESSCSAFWALVYQ